MSLQPFVQGLIAGYGIAIPVGPIAILIVEIGIRRGFPVAFCAGAGAASADLVYATVASIAGTFLVSVLRPYSSYLHCERCRPHCNRVMAIVLEPEEPRHTCG